MVTSGEIVVRGLGELTKVLQYEMHNKMSMHPKARLICEVAQNFRILELTGCDDQIHIEKSDTGEKIFTGYVEKVALEEHPSGYYMLDVTLIGGSILLDQRKKCRSYQDVSLKHKDVIEKVAEDTPAVIIECELMDDVAICKPLIQYEESDWEFVKRVASRLNEPAFVDETIQMPYVHVGSSRHSSGRNVNAHLVGEGMDARFYRLGELAKENGRAAYYFYKVTGKENYGMGEQVAYNGSQFYVCEKEARLECEEVLYTYTLAKESYMKIPPLYNPRLTGASILGEIKKVSGETMELKLNLRDEAENSVCYAYDWRPEVGNLMYCMPKKGTIVSLYFPSHDEQEAYAVNCVRRIGKMQETLFDETTKSFLTEDGKFMAMASSAMHMCAVNYENDKDYAQLSMVDMSTDVMDTIKPTEIAVEDIFEKMGLMLAGNHDIQMYGASILLEGVYVDLFASGKVSLMTGAMDNASRANASIVLAAAYFSITANNGVLFALTGRVGDNTFCVILDEPNAAADKGELLRNVVIGLVITALVAVVCVVALPVAMGGLVAAGTITAATASSIAMGAAVGATATGVFAVAEQYNSDKERGEASTMLQTATNIGFKSLAGAAEGALMAYFGGTKIVAEGTKFLPKQTAKNIGKRFLLNQGGSFLVQTGEVTAGLLGDALGGKQYTTDHVINSYLTGVVTGAFTTGLDVIKEVPFVKKASKSVASCLENKLKNTKLGKFIEDYGDIKKYGDDDVKQKQIVEQGKSAVTNAKESLDTMEDAAVQKVDAIKEQIIKTENSIEMTPLGRQSYLKNQKKYLEKKLGQAIKEVEMIDTRILQQQNKINYLKENTWQEYVGHIGLRWNTWSACSTIKIFTDIGDNKVKRALGEEVVKENVKENIVPD